MLSKEKRDSQDYGRREAILGGSPVEMGENGRSEWKRACAHWVIRVGFKYGRRDFFPEDCNILDFLSTLFQLIFSQLRKTPTVPLHLLHTASAAHCAQNNTKKWRFSRATICMVFLLWDMIFTKVITWAEKISTLYTQLWARGSEALCSEATV